MLPVTTDPFGIEVRESLARSFLCKLYVFASLEILYEGFIAGTVLVNKDLDYIASSATWLCVILAINIVTMVISTLCKNTTPLNVLTMWANMTANGFLVASVFPRILQYDFISGFCIFIGMSTAILVSLGILSLNRGFDFTVPYVGKICIQTSLFWLVISGILRGFDMILLCGWTISFAYISFTTLDICRLAKKTETFNAMDAIMDLRICNLDPKKMYEENS